jgi:hypothetical protein
MEHMTHEVSTQAILLGWILISAIPLLLVVALLGIRVRLFAWLAVASGVALQGFHSLEHVIQVVFWGRDPYAAPYMSPLAKQAAAGLESIAANTFGFRDFPTLGMELLHLVGNTLFLLGVLALLIGTPFSNRRGAATIAFVFEGTHLLEHIILTSSVLNGSPAWGSSTLFANISGAQLSTHRIWWHFVMNIAALALFLWALLRPGLTTTARNITIGLLISVNFLPVLVAHFSVEAATGYPSVLNILGAPVIALALNPVTFTALLLSQVPTRTTPPKSDIEESDTEEITNTTGITK